MLLCKTVAGWFSLLSEKAIDLNGSRSWGKATNFYLNFCNESLIRTECKEVFGFNALDKPRKLSHPVN